VRALFGVGVGVGALRSIVLAVISFDATSTVEVVEVGVMLLMTPSPPAERGRRTRAFPPPSLLFRNTTIVPFLLSTHHAEHSPHGPRHDDGTRLPILLLLSKPARAPAPLRDGARSQSREKL
jgi:hypothetical protein